MQHLKDRIKFELSKDEERIEMISRIAEKPISTTDNTSNNPTQTE